MKRKRQAKIVQLIEQYKIETQEELARSVAMEGFHAAQATISRDIREIGLQKVTDENGKTYYKMPLDYQNGEYKKYQEMLGSSVISVEAAGNLVVVKTKAGMGMAVAYAFDGLRLKNVIGSIGGDDTVFLAVNDAECSKGVAFKIEAIFKAHKD